MVGRVYSTRTVGEVFEGDFIEADHIMGCVVNVVRVDCKLGRAYIEVQERPEQEDGFAYVRIEDGRFRFV